VHDVTDVTCAQSWFNNPLTTSLTADIYKVRAGCCGSACSRRCASARMPLHPSMISQCESWITRRTSRPVCKPQHAIASGMFCSVRHTLLLTRVALMLYWRHVSIVWLTVVSMFWSAGDQHRAGVPGGGQGAAGDRHPCGGAPRRRGLCHPVHRQGEPRWYRSCTWEGRIDPHSNLVFSGRKQRACGARCSPLAEVSRRLSRPATGSRGRSGCTLAQRHVVQHLAQVA